MKKLGTALLFFILIVVSVFVIKFLPQVEIATGYAAKNSCSYYYQGRELTDIKAKDLEDFPLNMINVSLDSSTVTVSASLFGLKKKKAIYRKGLGCTLLQGTDDYHIERLSYDQDKRGLNSTMIAKSSLANINREKLEDLQNTAMDQPGEWEKKTTSLLVIHQDSLVAEFYSEGFDSETEILGWSMTKSICSLIAGIMSSEGLLDINEKNLFPAWENDERKNITMANLLKMNSGLDWQEEYDGISDITHGLFMEEDIVAYARTKSLEHQIGDKWKYSSGSTNLISGVMKRQFESYQDYLDYPYLKLFKPLGIQQAAIETDESGNYIMSSYMFAKARDWAKFGLLCLHKGHWNDKQLIDSSYMEWALKPAEADPNYGAQFWLNTNHKDYASAPEDSYKFSGYNGQYLIIIPSEEMVIVRTGLSKGPPFDMDAVIKKTLNLITTD